MPNIIDAVQALVKGRGMRPGRALRRVRPDLADDVVGAVARIFGRVRISSERAEFIGAYYAVRSCMQGRGEALHAFYARNGVEIAVARNAEGAIVARALVKGRRFCTTYGDEAFALAQWLLLAGFEQTERWLGSAPLVNPGARVVRITERVCTQAQRREVVGWYARTDPQALERLRDAEARGHEAIARGAWLHWEHEEGFHRLVAVWTARARTETYERVEGGVEIPYIDGLRPDIITEEEAE